MGEGLKKSFATCLGDSALSHSITPTLTSWPERRRLYQGV